MSTYTLINLYEQCSVFKCKFLLEYRLLGPIPQDPHLRLGPRNYISDKFLGDVNDVGPGIDFEEYWARQYMVKYQEDV